ncbi:unnamed protein product [Polarella glacialis]|uniref:Spermidine synthase n=1 Tax=Polarella glacialis TaxID=89957 RepID=A0A813EFL7_POLGL|nr:unnamed protein product [Polarella glacialis]
MAARRNRVAAAAATAAAAGGAACAVRAVSRIGCLSLGQGSPGQMQASVAQAALVVPPRLQRASSIRLTNWQGLRPRCGRSWPSRASMEISAEMLPFLPAAAALAAGTWVTLRRTASSSSSSRATIFSALDPGRSDLNHEFLTAGRLLLDMELESGGVLQVTAHEASESEAPDGAPADAIQEWRALRFKPAEGSNNLIQSVTKVCISPTGAEPRTTIQGTVLPLAYTQTFATIVLATLSVLGAPVLEEVARKTEDRLRILCIGLGGGSVPSFFAQRLPHCDVDVVELEPAVAKAATEAMGFVEGPHLRVHVEDGVSFALRAVEDARRTGDSAVAGGLYDAVLVDAYAPDGSVPSSLWDRQEGIEGLGTALARGLLRRRGGLVATNFLPEVDLVRPLAAYGEALAAWAPGRGFSVQANKPADEKTDLERIFTAEGTGNRIVVYTCGGPPELASESLATLRKRLEDAADKVGKATGCPFDMSDLVGRGISEWPDVLQEAA